MPVLELRSITPAQREWKTTRFKIVSADQNGTVYRADVMSPNIMVAAFDRCLKALIPVPCAEVNHDQSSQEGQPEDAA